MALREVVYPKPELKTKIDAICPDCKTGMARGTIPCPDGRSACGVVHYGYICSGCGKVWQGTPADFYESPATQPKLHIIAQRMLGIQYCAKFPKDLEERLDRIVALVESIGGEPTSRQVAAVVVEAWEHENSKAKCEDYDVRELPGEEERE